MCLTFCHVQQRLYWDHENCHPAECEFAGKIKGRCDNCRHRDKDRCLLTNTALPLQGGCCHYNVELIQGEQLVTLQMLVMVVLDPDESLAEALGDRNVRYRSDIVQDRVFVDPDNLPLPTTYGIGTDHQKDEEFDWSGWYQQWAA